MATERLGEYEYAGFRYTATRVTPDGGIPFVFLTVVPGQHQAAYKEKHLKAALECFLEDRAWAEKHRERL